MNRPANLYTGGLDGQKRLLFAFRLLVKMRGLGGEELVHHAKDGWDGV